MIPDRARQLGEREAETPERPAATLLRVDIRGKSFASGNRGPILGDILLDIKAQEIIAVLGPSGSGKTTLLRMIAGLDADFNGQITGSDGVVGAPSARRGLVFQDARLLAWRTVRQNVAFGLPGSMKEVRSARVDQMLELVGLSPAQHAWPRELSGGMEKRAALARALVGSPDLLMLDEPFGALDIQSRLGLQDELVSLHRQLGFSVLLVTHDIEEAVYLADRIVILGGSPAGIRDEIAIDLGHPRDRLSDPFSAARARVLARVIDTDHHHR